MAVLDEANLRSSGDQNLQNQVGALVSLTTDDKDNLVAAINELDAHVDAEVARAEAAETALKNAINGQHFTFTSPTAALSHVIDHGLNSEHLLFSVLVEGADGKFRNDIVPVEEIDYNNFRIDLAEARRVKVSVKSMTALTW